MHFLYRNIGSRRKCVFVKTENAEETKILRSDLALLRTCSWYYLNVSLPLQFTAPYIRCMSTFQKASRKNILHSKECFEASVMPFKLNKMF